MAVPFQKGVGSEPSPKAWDCPFPHPARCPLLNGILPEKRKQAVCGGCCPLPLPLACCACLSASLTEISFSIFTPDCVIIAKSLISTLTSELRVRITLPHNVNLVHKVREISSQGAGGRGTQDRAWSSQGEQVL